MRTETISAILKDFGPVQLCKGICARERSACGETELVTLLTKAASEQHPSLRPDQAFAKLYEGEESVRRACSVAKACEFFSHRERRKRERVPDGARRRRDR